MLKAELSPSASLPEVHGSVQTTHATVFRRMLAFAGPAYLVSVGYMDPGNWATDLEGGARFGYRLLWVLVVSNLMAILLQTLAARLGIVAGRDLAQACRESYSRRVCNALWVLCEIAIAACDLAEVLGAAIALRLLFGLPLLVGVLVTALDTLLVLWLSRYGIRLIEAVILSLIAIVTGCFLVELVWAKPAWHEMAAGLLPRLNNSSLYVAIGILGATVMPHNLYLHSALVQTRRLGRTVAERREACRFNLFDSVLALNGALIVNAAILVLAAAVFFKHGILVTQIEQAQLLLTPLLGTALAGSLFAVALLASGQSSTLTGTFAGQIVMEGFLNLRLRPWLRRLVTRSLAIIPAVLTIYYFGRQRHFQTPDPEPGDPQHAASVRGDPSDPLHQRLAAHGRVRQSRLGADTGLERRRRYRRPEFVAGRDHHRTVDGGNRLACAGWWDRRCWRSSLCWRSCLSAGPRFPFPASGRGRPEQRPGSGRRSAGAALSQHSGAARSLRSRPHGACSRRGHGAFARGLAALAARGRRRHQPVVRRALFDGRDSFRRAILRRHRAVARSRRHFSRVDDSTRDHVPPMRLSRRPARFSPTSSSWERTATADSRI